LPIQRRQKGGAEKEIQSATNELISRIPVNALNGSDHAPWSSYWTYIHRKVPVTAR